MAKKLTPVLAGQEGLSRRGFLNFSAITGCSAFAASKMSFAQDLIAKAEAGQLGEEELYELAKAENTLYSACLNCNTGCGIKVKVIDGVAVKIDGNPYNPFTLNPHLPMTESLDRAARVDSGICPKGQAGHTGAYDPWRIRKVLKRTGKRGEGKWQSIPFAQAMDEIANGGKLFAHVPGEESRVVTGMKEIWSLRDPKVFAAMSEDVELIRKKKLTVAQFKTKHAANLHHLIDPEHPDFGPKNNQFVYMWGRKKGGRAEFDARFTGAFGTANTHGHTTVCQGSLYFASKAISEQYVGDSCADAYPYGIKALFSYMGAPTYSLPAGQTQIEALTNLDRIPLYFASDITIGTTSMYADYIIPDLHYMERWEFMGSHPNMPVKVQPVRQPVIASPNEVVTVFGEEQPLSIEAVWLGLAERLGLPGFGKDAFGPGQDLRRPDDFYLRMVANVAHDGKESVPDASDKDLEIFLKGRKHLPKSVFNVNRWQAICGASWKKVVYVLNHGGRFDTQEASFKGDMVANKWGKQVNLYQEKTWKAKDAFTGKHFFGLARFVPIVNVMGEEPTAFMKGHDLHLVTQRDVRMTKSRTITNSYLSSHMPENAIIIHTSDAKRLGLRKGQKVKVVSATNPKGEYDLKNGKTKAMIGKVLPTETIRPGVVTFTLGHGHWATGAADMTVDGTVIKGDPKRGGGIHANAAMWIDPYLKNTCMIDKVGGSVSFYDTRVKLVKVKA